RNSRDSCKGTGSRAAVVERELLDVTSADRSSNRGVFCVDRCIAAGHLYRLADLGKLEFDFNSQALASVELHIGHLEVRESRLARSNLIPAGLEIQKLEISLRVGLACARDILIKIPDLDRGPRDSRL